MRSLIAALLVTALIPAAAYAGGGGAKPTSTIAIRNIGLELLAVIVNPPANLNVNDLAAFRAQGGKTLNAGETAIFKTKEGQQAVSAAFINVGAGAPGPIKQENIQVGKNKTVNLHVNGNSANAPTISVK